MEMTHEEIQRNYREAKNKNRQIGILAELNDCSRSEIEDILGIDEKPAELYRVEMPAELTRGEIMDMLFSKMDALEQEIKKLEEEYRNISITIEVLGKIGGKG